MPSETFEIQSYEVTASPRGYATYILSVISPAFHGIRTRAYIYFHPENNLPTTIGRAINVDTWNFQDSRIYCWADEKYLESMYHVLQTEDPVSFRYAYDSGETSSRRLRNFDLTTGKEPTGEGMAEQGLQMLVNAGELDLDEMDPEQLGVEDVDVLRPTEDFADIEQTSN
jgi:hypothetical protein